MSLATSSLSALWRIWGWVGIGLYLIIVVQMGRLLFAPGPDDGEAILTFGVLMGFEFILVHSGVFMAVLGRSISLLLLVPVYGLFAYAFNLYAPNNAVLWLYLGVVATRMRFAFSSPSEDAINANVLFSVGAVTAYFFLVMAFAFGSDLVPRFGLTETYMSSINYTSLHDSGGIFIDSPHVPLAMGMVYFTFLAWMEWGLYKSFR